MLLGGSGMLSHTLFGYLSKNPELDVYATVRSVRELSGWLPTDWRNKVIKDVDVSNADDLYGRTKFLGEVVYPHCVTLRTLMIEHELEGNFGLVEWFLKQESKVRGFRKVIYSGFPTIELARIISDYVISNSEITGLYHVSSDPISKYELLKLIKLWYGKKKWKSNQRIAFGSRSISGLHTFPLPNRL